MTTTVTLVLTELPWDQLVCSEQIGVQIIQFKFNKKFLYLNFIQSSLCTGSRCIQDRV